MKTMGFSILVLGIISLLDKRSYDKIKFTGMQDVQLKPPGVSFAFIYFGGQHCKHVIHILHKQLCNGPALILQNRTNRKFRSDGYRRIFNIYASSNLDPSPVIVRTARCWLVYPFPN